MNFEAYLVSKKIDSEAFRQAEQNVWSSWQAEFEQLHPNSFTAQKLYLINPVRRKYPLKVEVKIKAEEPKTLAAQLETSRDEPGTTEPSNLKPQTSKPVVPRPVFKQPKPKIN